MKDHGFSETENKDNSERTNFRFSSVMDIKGAILLTITITSFLLSITYIDNINSFENNHNNNSLNANTTRALFT